MFLLAAALAAFADDATARGARAATHELARRFGGGPVRTPTLSERILAFYDRFEKPKGMKDVWSAVEESVTRLIRAAIGDRLLDENPRFRIKRTPTSRIGHGVAGHRIPIPIGDTQQRVGIRFEEKPYEPSVRTPRDGLVQVVLDAWWTGNNAPYASATYTEMLDALPSIHDWMDATSPSLAGMDWPAVLAASRAWHRQFRTDEAGGPAPIGLVILRWPDGWTLQRLLTKADLAAEGTAMQHCVGGPDRGEGRRDGESSYWQEMRDGKIAILSLRDPNGSPEATIEVNLKREPYQAGIEQIQGPFDEEPPVAARKHLVEAAMKLGWWTDPDSDRRLPRLGRIPVFTDGYIEKGGLASRMESALSVNPIAGYTLRILSDLANKKPDEFDAARQRRLRTAVAETLKDVFRFPFYWVTADLLPLGERGGEEPGTVLGILAQNTSRRLTMVWRPVEGLRWVLQEQLSAPGRVFRNPYDALRAFTETYADIPRAALEAIEVLPGLPGRADRSGAWAVDVGADEATSLRRAQAPLLGRPNAQR